MTRPTEWDRLRGADCPGYLGGAPQEEPADPRDWFASASVEQFDAFVDAVKACAEAVIATWPRGTEGGIDYTAKARFVLAEIEEMRKA